jgi:cellobiose dehydrogenase (acceptor)
MYNDSLLTGCRHITTNPTSYIVTAAEHAAAKILALGTSGGGSGDVKRAGAVRGRSY